MAGKVDGNRDSDQFVQEFAQGKIVFATRAPNSSDKGQFWVTYTAANDATITLYIRHPHTGTWRSEAFT